MGVIITFQIKECLKSRGWDTCGRTNKHVLLHLCGTTLSKKWRSPDFVRPHRYIFNRYVFVVTLIISYFADEWLPVNGHYLFPNINGYQNRFIFWLSYKSCNYSVQHWTVSPLQTHYLTMVVALYEGIKRRNAATIVLQHVSVQYSPGRALLSLTCSRSLFNRLPPFVHSSDLPAVLQTTERKSHPFN